MSLFRDRRCVSAGLLLGVLLLPGCGESTEPAVVDAPSETVVIDSAQMEKEKSESRKNYDPRQGAPADTSGSASSPSSI